MAEKVTGTIGQEEVELNNAASEATLVRLLKVMEGKGASGGNNKAAGNLHELAKQSGKTTKELEELEEAANSSSNALSRGFSQITGAVKGLASEALLGGDKLSDFTQHITGALSAIPIFGGVIGGVGQLLVSVLDNQIDAFRELSNVGIDLGGSLFEAKLQATKTGMSFESFQTVLSNNSEGLAKLGGTAGNGAKMFVALQSQVSQSANQFLLMGMQMEEIGEFTAGYMRQQQRLGRTQGLTSAAGAASAQAYIKEIDKLAKITGKSRQEVQDQMDAAAQDDRLALVMSTMSSQAQLAIKSTVAMLTSRDAELGEAVTEMIATGGIPYTEAGNALLNLNPGIAAAAKALHDGVPGAAEQMAIEMEKARQVMINKTDAEKLVLAAMAADGDVFAQTQSRLLGLGNTVVALTEAEIAAKALEADKEAERSRQSLLFSNTVTKLRNSITDALITSGVFDTVQAAMSSLTTAFNGVVTDDGPGGLNAVVEGISTVMSDLLKSFKEGNLMETIGGYLSTGLSKLGELISPHISTAMSGLMNLAKDVIFGKRAMEGPDHDQQATGEREGGALSEFLGMLAGPALLAGLTSLGGLLAAGGLITLGFRALTSVFRMFANGPVAIGAAVFTAMLIGTGAAITLAGNGINLAGDGIEKIAAGVEKMANMKGATNFAEIATSLGLLGPALISLTAGGVLESITSFFGADSPFDKIVEGLNKFKNIDATAIENVKLSGTALEALSKFGDDLDVSSLRLYADQMERLGNSFEKINDELTKDNSWLPFSNGNNAGNTTMPSGTAGTAGTGSSDQLTLLNTKLDTLIEVTRLTNTINRTGFREASGSF